MYSENLERLNDINKLDPDSRKYKIGLNMYKTSEWLFDFARSSYVAYYMSVIITVLHLYFFKNLNHSLKNNVWFSIYCTAHLSLLGLPIVVFYWSLTITKILSIGFTLLAMIYRFWACIKFYDISWKKSLKKNFLLSLFSTLILILSIAITGILMFGINLKYNIL